LAENLKGPDPNDLLKATGRYMGLGMTLTMSVVFFLGVGWWVDSKLGTTPLFMVIGAFVGAAAGFYSLYYHIVIEPRQREGRSK